VLLCVCYVVGVVGGLWWCVGWVVVNCVNLGIGGVSLLRVLVVVGVDSVSRLMLVVGGVVMLVINDCCVGWC